MKRRNDPEVAAWLEKADGDLRVARFALTAEDPLLDQACFHSQQTAEKALKALFVAAELPVPKTHDLLLLADGLETSCPEVEPFAPALAALTPYSVTPRYPSWLAPETRTEAEEAVRSAGALLDAVMQMLDR